MVLSVVVAHGSVPIGSGLSCPSLPALLGRFRPLLKETILQRLWAKRVSAPCTAASEGALATVESLGGTVKARRIIGEAGAFSGVEGALIATSIMTMQILSLWSRNVAMQALQDEENVVDSWPKCEANSVYG